MSSSATTIANPAFSDGFVRFCSNVGSVSPTDILHSPARPTGAGMRLGRAHFCSFLPAARMQETAQRTSTPSRASGSEVRGEQTKLSPTARLELIEDAGIVTGADLDGLLDPAAIEPLHFGDRGGLVHPYTGEVGMIIGSFRRWRCHIGSAVGSARHAWLAKVQPLPVPCARKKSEQNEQTPVRISECHTVKTSL